METESTAIALLKPARLTEKPKKRDKDIYLLSRRGWSDDALATQFKLNPLTVKEARDRYQLYRDSLATDEQDLALAEMVARVMPKSEKVLVDAMKADRHILTKSGGTKKVADHETRLKAVEMVKGIIETSRPKGGGIQINTQVNSNQPGGGVQQGVRSFDFEARLRTIREKKGLKNDEVEIADGEYEDGEEVDVLGDELAEMGIELDEDDDEEEDDE